MDNLGQVIVNYNSTNVEAIKKINPTFMGEWAALVLGHDEEGKYHAVWILKEPFKGFGWKGEVRAAMKTIGVNVKQASETPEGQIYWDLCYILRVTAFIRFYERNSNNKRLKNVNLNTAFCLN